MIPIKVSSDFVLPQKWGGKNLSRPRRITKKIKQQLRQTCPGIHLLQRALGRLFPAPGVGNKGNGFQDGRWYNLPSKGEISMF